MTDELFPNRVNLYNLCNQTNSDDGEFMANRTTFSAIGAMGGLEGELDRADTVASTMRGTGRQAIETQVAMLTHHPGILAEYVGIEALLIGAETSIASASQARPSDRQRVRARLESELGPGPITALAEVTAAADRTARQAVNDAFAVQTVDAAAIVGSVEDADVSAAAADAVSGPLQSVRIGINKFVRERNALLASANVSEARAISEALDNWLSDRGAALAQIETQAADEREQRLAEANAALANEDDTGTQNANPQPRSWIPTWMRGFMFDEAETVSPRTAATTSPVVTPLRLALRAGIVRTAASRMRVGITALQGSTFLTEDDINRLVGPVRGLADRARMALAHLDEEAQHHQCRIRGTFLPAFEDIRRSVREHVIGMTPEALAERLIRVPLAACLEPGMAVNENEFENRALEAARGLTQAIRAANVSQVLEYLPAERIDQFAQDLAALSPTLAFREGHPPPQVARRVAVPGGERSRLGKAIRRRFVNVTVTPSNHPLIAYGVAITDVFATPDLRDYHGAWYAAREEKRREGVDGRLVSDRRLLDLDDGITTDDDLDRIIVKAVACGALAPSKEAPVGGTWYFVPVTQAQRPAELETGRLDAVFGKWRAGRTTPEIRKTLRNSPAHRELAEERWADWCSSQPLSERSARLDTLVAQALVPSDDLASVCRDIKAELHRERRSRFGAA